MMQFVITPAAAKRLIGLALAAHPAVQAALRSSTLVIIAGTTNGYVAEEILKTLGQEEDFSKKRFFRGIILRAGKDHRGGKAAGREPFSRRCGDSERGLAEGYDHLRCCRRLERGRCYPQGANALDPVRHQAAVSIGHPRGGTIIAALQAAVGRRVRLILPVGLEKRIPGDLMELAVRMNAPGGKGPRLLPVPGEVFTEIDAIRLLCGAEAEIMAAGGVGGAEGAVWLALQGSPEQMEKAEELMKEIVGEKDFEM